MAKKDNIDDILNDPLGLLGDVKPKATASQTENDRLIASFEEINAFFEVNKREPNKENGIQEFQLEARLKGFRESPEKAEILKSYDRFNLLKEVEDYVIISLPTNNLVSEPPPSEIIKEKEKSVEINSIDDILNDDSLGLLEDVGNSIFDLKYVKPKSIDMPDYVAKRKPCKDFEKFESLLRQCQKDLSGGKRKLLPFAKEQQINKGNFFVLKGVLLYIDKVGKKKTKKGKVNARLRCIFENGTESDMLLRSLSAELYKDGRRVSEHDEKLLDNFKNITEEDEPTGYIYVLKSLSTHPEIAPIKNLYKIGYSSTTVEERIKNAEQQPTYLMAGVKIVSIYKVYNALPTKFEALLHRFFGSACLDVNLFDSNNQLYRPREWFVAPFEVIDQAVGFILNGEIVKYRYDVEKEAIVGR